MAAGHDNGMIYMTNVLHCMINALFFMTIVWYKTAMGLGQVRTI